MINKTTKFLLLISILIGFASCSQDEPIQNNQNLPFRTIDDSYGIWGKMHNDFLDQALDNYHPNSAEKVIGDEEAHPNYDALNAAQINYARSLNLPSDEEEALCEALVEYKPYYEPDKCFNDYFINKSSNTPVIQQKINYLYQSRMIDEFEYSLLTSLVTDVINIQNGVTNSNGFKILLYSYFQQWNQHFGYMENNQGQLSAYILSIADASYTWWSENNVTGTRLAPWIAADAAGAIVGGAVNAAKQYITNRRISNWKKVGYNALASGVIASTGVVGKLTKWFIKI